MILLPKLRQNKSKMAEALRYIHSRSDFYDFNCYFRTYIDSIILFGEWSASLQITFSYKPVICQARDKVWPNMQPVWSDEEGIICISVHFRRFCLTLFLDRQRHLRCLLNYLMKTTRLLNEYWQHRRDTWAVNENESKCITAIILTVHLRVCLS